jgi:peptidoglycan hydrolase CwlO-like protein
MSTNVKIIISVTIVLIAIVGTICIFVYINHLNNKISDLSVTIKNQSNEISRLQCNIDSLESEVSTLHETIDITNNYISNIEKVKSDEDAVKQAIYEEVISDEETKDWFNEKLPAGIINIINDANNDGMCKDSY